MRLRAWLFAPVVVAACGSFGARFDAPETSTITSDDDCEPPVSVRVQSSLAIDWN